MIVKVVAIGITGGDKEWEKLVDNGRKEQREKNAIVINTLGEFPTSRKQQKEQKLLL